MGWACHAVTLFVCAVVSPGASAQLYSQDFEADSSASWTVNLGPSDSAADFLFDYSTVGVPPAPSGAGTRGLKLQANLFNGVFGGFSVSPTGLNVSGDYVLSFDWWANFNGPFPGGGSGSTNLSTFGIGTEGAQAQWQGGVTDCLWFAATGDGGSAFDYRVYSTAAPTGYLPSSGVYFAPTNNSSDPYFAGFGGVAAPASQAALFPQQAGLTSVGSAGMQWHTVEIVKSGEVVTWSIDGLPVASIDLFIYAADLFGGNIFFGHADTNATSSTDLDAP